MDRTAFVIFENDRCEPDCPPSVIGICSTRDKADKALDILGAKNRCEFIEYFYEEYDLDKITIFL